MTLNRSSRWLIVILLVAFVLRLGYALAQDQQATYVEGGGDSAWYLRSGYELITGDSPAPLSTAPLYLLFIGFWQVIFSRAAGAIIAIRICQVIMSTALCFFGFRLARVLTGQVRAGLVLAGVLAVSPVFVLEAAQVLTETLYVFLVVGGLWLYVEYIVEKQHRGLWMAAAVGILLGLATLTRAVLLLFPLGLVLHLLLLRGWRAGLRQAVVLLAVYAALVSTWTIYNLARWDRLVIGADGFASFLYMGARGWEGPHELDAALEEDVPEMTEDDIRSPDKDDKYLTGASRTIQNDPAGYIRRRVSEWLEAYLQPHGTVLFSGESLKELAREWITENRSPRGLIDLMGRDAFWPKLALYIFHFAGLIGGALGLWLYRRRWQVALPLAGFIVYTSLIHTVLMATPRYIFPVELFWWVFAAAAWNEWQARRQSATVQAVGTIRENPA